MRGQRTKDTRKRHEENVQAMPRILETVIPMYLQRCTTNLKMSIRNSTCSNYEI